MKAAGWEASGDAHPARAAPLLWSAGPPWLFLAFIASSTRGRLLPINSKVSVEAELLALGRRRV